MITRKCHADNALNTTDCVAVASQAANAYSCLTKCFYLLTYLRYSSVPTAINSFNERNRTCSHLPGSHCHISLAGVLCADLLHLQ